MKKMSARNKFLWRGYFLTIIQQKMLKVDVCQHGTAHCFGKKNCFCFKSQKKEKKTKIKKGRKSGLLHFPENGVSTAVWAGYRQLAAARNVILD